MLTIRAPSMGSSQPPELNIPLGFPVEPDPDSDRLGNPPAPASNIPLLSEGELLHLQSFFDNFNPANYNIPSFGEGLNLSDADAIFGLPPQFMGSATSFGQQPAVAPMALTSPHLAAFGGYHGTFGMSHSLMGPPSLPQPAAAQVHPAMPHMLPSSSNQQHSADVLAAATLLQNGSVGRLGGGGYGHQFSNPGQTPSLDASQGHLRHQDLADFTEESRRSASQRGLPDQHDRTFADMVFGSADRADLSGRHPQPTDMQWGSDSRFNQVQGFVPLSDKETAESVEKQHYTLMQCLEVNKSADTTRPSSPVEEEGYLPPKLHSRKTSELAEWSDDENPPPPQKRRKSTTTKSGVDGASDEIPPKAPTRRRKQTSDGGITATASTSIERGVKEGSRKASTPGKQPRENLTDQQKRENHIRSEQKRRAVIKTSYAELCEIVPGLNQGGLSKSATLNTAGDWLERLVEGNRELRTQLENLQGS